MGLMDLLNGIGNLGSDRDTTTISRRTLIKSVLGIAGMALAPSSAHATDVNITPFNECFDEPLRWLNDAVRKKNAPEPFFERYGLNIHYLDYDQIDLEDVPTIKIEPPYHFEERLNLIEPNIEDPKKLERLIFEQAETLGYERGRIKALSLREVLQLSMNIVTSRLTPRLVDDGGAFDENEDGREFVAQYGEHLHVERYLELGFGDCDKYSSAFIAVFNTIKGINPNMANVYAFDDTLGGNIQPHAWNSLVFLYDNHAEFTHIDLMFSEKDGDVRANRLYHLPNDDRQLLGNFFARLSEDRIAYSLYDELLRDTKFHAGRARLLSKMALFAEQLNDLRKMEYVRENFFALSPDVTDFKRNIDNILFHSYMVFHNNCLDEKAEEYKQRLLTEFPDSYWSKELRGEHPWSTE